MKIVKMHKKEKTTLGLHFPTQSHLFELQPQFSLAHISGKNKLSKEHEIWRPIADSVEVCVCVCVCVCSTSFSGLKVSGLDVSLLDARAACVKLVSNNFL